MRMEQGSTLRKDIDSFQQISKKLSDAIRSCGIDWRDEQFQKMTYAIQTLAASTKQLVSDAAECETAIKRFRQIESEK